MAFTFNTDLSTGVDRVRLKIGDIDEDDPIFQDETYDALLLLYPNETLCAIQACEAAIAKLARIEVNRTVVSMNVSRSQKIENLRAVLSNLRKELADGGQPVLTGASKAEKWGRIENTDACLSPFERNPYTGQRLKGVDSFEVDEDCP